MFKYACLLIACSTMFFSCGQIVNSIIEESAKEVDQKNNEAFEETDYLARDSFNIIDRNIMGADTLTLVQSYFYDGQKYYESWQNHGLAQGKTTFFYPSGKTRYSLLYVNGRPNTLLSCFDQQGRKLDGGTLKNGDGLLMTYDPYTGKLIYKSEYRNGLKNGSYTSCFSDGRKGAEAVFINDTIVGSYTKYYRSGKIYSKGNVDMRTETGIIDTYYANGNIQKRDEYRDGKRYAYIEYDLNGTVNDKKKLINGELIEEKYFYGSEGKLLSREHLMGDKKHGACEYFYNNGSKKSREIYRNDTLQSDTIWYSSGKISAESHYKNGLKTGVYREYYPTGTVRVEQMYVNGVEEGMYKSYFASGQIYNEGQFKDGKLSGELKFYSEKGKLTHTKQYN
jgi:antitoxin component YwqK of YwqJK toxin-antitoxin module